MRSSNNRADYLNLISMIVHEVQLKTSFIICTCIFNLKQLVFFIFKTTLLKKNRTNPPLNNLKSNK